MGDWRGRLCGAQGACRFRGKPREGWQDFAPQPGQSGGEQRLGKTGAAATGRLGGLGCEVRPRQRDAPPPPIKVSTGARSSVNTGETPALRGGAFRKTFNLVAKVGSVTLRVCASVVPSFWTRA